MNILSFSIMIVFDVNLNIFEIQFVIKKEYSDELAGNTLTEPLLFNIQHSLRIKVV
jgi:hypothetical protein